MRASCQLGDHTPYAAYRLDLPVRGQIKIELSGNASDFSLILRDASGIRLDSGAGLRRSIEAGSYTLLVNGRTAGESGSFTVNTSFTSEPGMLCSNFTNIGRSQTLEGRLPGSGCLAPDGTPYEAYAVTTDGAGTLTVTAGSGDFTPVIAVRSIDGLRAFPALDWPDERRTVGRQPVRRHHLLGGREHGRVPDHHHLSDRGRRDLPLAKNPRRLG